MCCAGLKCEMFEKQGFHGTTAEEAEGILKTGFNIVENEDLYLGDGAYFFIDGIGNPCEDALDFATNVKKMKNPVVVRADISAEKESVLNLCSVEGAKLFSKFKELFYDKRGAEKGKMDDGKIINYLVGEMEFETKIVISSRCVKLKKEDARSQIPNCIFCCVKNKDCISNEQLVAYGG